MRLESGGVQLAEQAGFPAGVLNLVHGSKDAVDALLDHPDFRPKLAHIIPTFQNPAGYTLSREDELRRDVIMSLMCRGRLDFEAIERAKQGDAEAFEFLFGLHKRRVYSLCLRMTANTAEAEDLTQEAFLQLFRKIATFRGESAFSTWLHRMAVNVVLMQLRKKSLPVVPLEETLENEEETPKKELGAAKNCRVSARPSPATSQA